MNKLILLLIVLLSIQVYCDEEVLDNTCQATEGSTCEDQILGKILTIEELDVSELTRLKTSQIYASRQTPLLIKNVLKQEDLEKLTVPWFCDFFGNVTTNYRTGVALDLSDSNHYNINNKDRKKTSVQSYCDTYLYKDYNNKYEAPYMAKFNKWHHFQALELPMERFEWLFDKVPNASIWLGTKNSGTFLHVDSLPNFSLQLNGVKKWTLIEKTQAPKACFNEEYPSKFSWSAYDIDQEESCPTGKYADRYVVDMQPGDVLFLPKTYPHTVNNEEVNLMVNFWLLEKHWKKSEDKQDDKTEEGKVLEELEKQEDNGDY